ncbi:uncharacterized protein LOC122645010 [Telopea speciosissima]|uniref:uncharacterized protein LOC122645010 n=1 Tax=Telopea speciosissima TaxID=54955 RepID=UPI001CC4A12B|nr:uncharacterized protein LOC122645010 [Telopea speciosissima]
MANFMNSLSVLILMFVLIFECMLIVPGVVSTPAPTQEIIDITNLPPQSVEVAYLESPDSEIAPDEAQPGYFEYLDNCTKQIPEECGTNIIGGLFGDVVVSKYCCINLVEMGQDCHFALVKEFGKLKVDKKEPYYKKIEYFKYFLPKTGPGVWNHCVKIVKGIDVAPSPSLF